MDDVVSNIHPAVIARQVTGHHLTHHTRLQGVLDDEASKIRLSHIARHITWYHLTHETRLQSAVDDVASNIRTALGSGALRARAPGTVRGNGNKGTAVRYGVPGRALQVDGIKTPC